MIGYRYLLTVLAWSTFVCSEVRGPFTKHFSNWLHNNNYDSYNFEDEKFGDQGSFGGKQHDFVSVQNTPVVFIHGNSDGALADGKPMGTGWTSSITYFMTKGYTSAELFSFTWGKDRNLGNAGSRTHDCDTLVRLRKFIDAVMQYTNKTQINIISHSMGVTLGRGLIRGQICNLGKSIEDKINVFIGIAGGCYGLCACSGAASNIYPSCGKDTGFFPGNSCGNNLGTCELKTQPVDCCHASIKYSSYLTRLNNFDYPEATKTYSFWSLADDIIENGDLVWTYSTSKMPHSEVKIFQNYTHMETKDQTVDIQYSLINPN
uniref:Lipase n=1 Tax=Rhabditophanes sp. KR3021 TaxID=114890 RepID=A0AC35TKJ3_9BILA